MSEKESRRNFIKSAGLTVGAAIVAPLTYAQALDNPAVKKLSPDQQEFMVEYGKWMDEFADLAVILKKDPENYENREKMLVLTNKAQEFRPELTKHLKDPIFSMIYKESIKKVTNQI